MRPRRELATKELGSMNVSYRAVAVIAALLVVAASVWVGRRLFSDESRENGPKSVPAGRPGDPAAAGGSVRRTPRGGGGDTVEDEPSEDQKAWLASLEAAILANDRFTVETLMARGKDHLPMSLPLMGRILESGSTSSRVLAVLVLRWIDREEAAKLLRGLLEPGEAWEVKKAAIDALVVRADAASADAILALLIDANENGQVRLAAADALGKIGNPDFAVQLLALALNDPDKQIRSTLLDVLGKLKNPAVVKSLIEAYRRGESKPGQRHLVAQALGEIGSNEATQLLVEIATADGDAALTRGAIQALMMIGSDQAKEALVEIATTSPNPEAIFTSLHMLSRVGGEQAQQTLRRQVDLHRDEKRVRDLCTLGLLYQGDEESVAKALEVMRSDPEMSGTFLDNINKKGNVRPEIVEKLEEAYPDLSDPQRSAVIDALGRVKGDGQQRACDALRKRFEIEEDLGKKGDVAYRLAWQKDSSAVKVLRREFDATTDNEYKWKLLESIGTIGGPDAELLLNDLAATDPGFGGMGAYAREQLQRLAAERNTAPASPPRR